MLLCCSARRFWSDWPACACIASRFAFTMPACFALLLRFLRAFQYMQTVWERMKRNEVQRNERAVCLLPFHFFIGWDAKLFRRCRAETVCDGLPEQSVGAELTPKQHQALPQRLHQKLVILNNSCNNIILAFNEKLCNNIT